MATDTIISQTIQCARKPHRCDHCCQPIETGEPYERVRGVWEGSPGVFKSHMECRDCALEMWKVRDYNDDEGILLSADVEPDDHEWIRAEYPVVAQRLGFGGQQNG